MSRILANAQLHNFVFMQQSCTYKIYQYAIHHFTVFTPQFYYALWNCPNTFLIQPTYQLLLIYFIPSSTMYPLNSSPKRRHTAYEAPLEQNKLTLFQISAPFKNKLNQQLDYLNLPHSNIYFIRETRLISNLFNGGTLLFY